MKKSTGLLALLLSATLSLTLTACTSQADNQADQTNTPTSHASINDTLPIELLSIRANNYDFDSASGIIDSNGKIIIPIDYTEKQVIRDENYRPVYIVTTKTTQSDELLEDLFSSLYSYDSVTHDGAIFNFYDTAGKLLQTVELSGRDISCHTSANMADTLFVYEETTIEKTKIEETTIEETTSEENTNEENTAEENTETTIAEDFAIAENITDLTDLTDLTDSNDLTDTPDTDIDINTDTDIDTDAATRTFTTMNVVNMAGETIVSQTFELPPDTCVEWAYNGICNATDWFALYYNSYGTSALEPDIYRNLIQGCHFYTRDGEPLAMPQDYTSVYQVYDYSHTSGSVITPYFQAQYFDSDGESAIDILDEHGQVLISGLESIGSYNNGVLSCSIKEENGKTESGLMNMQGEWLYKESVGTVIDLSAADNNDDSNPPRLINYYSSGGTAILNTAGVAVIPLDNIIEKSWYKTADDSGTYAMGLQDIYDYSRHNYWNRPLVSGGEFKFYSPTGELLQTVDLRGRGDIRFIPGETMDEGVFFCDMLNIDGTLLILRMDGAPITSVDLDIPSGTIINSITHGLTLGDNFVSANYSYSKDYSNYANGFICCTLDGEPIQLAHDYSTIYELYDAADRTHTTARYFRADYQNSQGIYLFDILDGNANVMISGLNSIDTLYGDHLLCSQGNCYGMIDIQQGNWLFRESIFTDLDD